MINVSLIDGHIDGAEQCVMCGRDIPEGSQVCVICGQETESKENKVYKAIVDYINNHQYPPTVRDLCKLTGITSTSVIHSKLKSLADKGYIEIDIKSARGIKVKAKTNYDRIRNMSVEEMSQFLIDVKMAGFIDGITDNTEPDFEYSKKWLESEVTE